MISSSVQVMLAAIQVIVAIQVMEMAMPVS